MDTVEHDALATGLISDEELNRWQQSPEQAEAEGTFFAHANAMLAPAVNHDKRGLFDLHGMCSFSRATPQDSWRHLKLALECPAESSFRAVSESISCLTRTHMFLTNPMLGQEHAPLCQVLYRRNAYQFGESLTKYRAGQVDFSRERSHCPWLLCVTMDQHERLPDVRITQRSQPA